MEDCHVAVPLSSVTWHTTEAWRFPSIIRTASFIMRFAYADPPYIGQAKRHYNSEEVDHQALIDRLVDEYPDGWALSLSSPTLKQVLNMCPDNVRVMAWVKPFCAFKPNVNPAYAWEPVIVRGGRKRGRTKPTVRDWVSANITLKKGLSGAKPVSFVKWLIEILGMEPEDTLDDLYPGTGIVGVVVEEWRKCLTSSPIAVHTIQTE